MAAYILEINVIFTTDAVNHIYDATIIVNWLQFFSLMILVSSNKIIESFEFNESVWYDIIVIKETIFLRIVNDVTEFRILSVI